MPHRRQNDYRRSFERAQHGGWSCINTSRSVTVQDRYMLKLWLEVSYMLLHCKYLSTDLCHTVEVTQQGDGRRDDLAD